MSKILEFIKSAEQGSNTYHLIEKVAENVKKENPTKNDYENWFEAQKRINRYFLEEKLAERMYENNPDIEYDTYLRIAKEQIKFLDIENIEKIVQDGISLEKIIECNLKSAANNYYTKRKNKDKESDLIKAFEDWKNAIDCVANKLSKYK